MHRLPFSLKLIVAYFACDAVANGARLAADLARRSHASVSLVDADFPLALALAIDVLLASLIAARSRAGRFWGIIFLGALAGLALFQIIVEPGKAWLELSQPQRARVFATIAIEVAFAAVLAGRRAGRILTR